MHADGHTIDLLESGFCDEARMQVFHRDCGNCGSRGRELLIRWIACTLASPVQLDAA
jgi:hypothetical protein